MSDKIIIFQIVIFLSFSVIGQKTALINNEQVSLINNMPQEQLYIVPNTTFLFAGEYLYYSLFNRSQHNEPSNLSKIAYVVLKNHKNEIVFKKKILLNKGLGYGDFFIPTSVRSGNYRLIGFTNWMLNFSENNYVSIDLSILNPYTNQRDESGLFSKKNEGDKLKLDENKTNESSVGVSTNKNTYNKRELVKISFEGENLEEGNYAISVRRNDIFENWSKFNKRKNLVNFGKSNSMQSKIGDSIYLPEFKGDLIYGRIKPILSSDHNTTGNKTISASLIGDFNEIMHVKTNNSGEFVLHINEKQISSEIRLQVLENDGKYTIELNDFPEIPLSANKIKRTFFLDEKFEQHILDRSLHNQIENNYFNIKPDSIKIDIKSKASFYGAKYSNYNLDDYTRFNSVSETIIELLPSVYIKKGSNDELKFELRKFQEDQGNNFFDPLILVDGYQIINHEDIISYNPSNIESIQIVRNNYFVGKTIYDGIISFETFDNVFLKNSVVNKNAFPVSNNYEESKEYFKQDYSYTKDSLIPDFRNQLLWNPNLKDIKETILYTSDIAGEFIVTLTGYTKNGSPVYTEGTFIVNE